MTTPLELTEEQAKAMGYESMTLPYQANENWMLDRALSDVTRRGRPAVLVRMPEGVEIWTPKAGWTGA